MSPLIERGDPHSVPAGRSHAPPTSPVLAAIIEEGATIPVGTLLDPGAISLAEQSAADCAIGTRSLCRFSQFWLKPAAKAQPSLDESRIS